MKCVREKRGDNVLVSGNTSLKCGKEMLEKSVSKVVKGKDSDSNCEGHMKHKHGEQWDLIYFKKSDHKLCPKNNQAHIRSEPLRRKDKEHR